MSLFKKLELGRWYRYEATLINNKVNDDAAKKEFIRGVLKYIGEPENKKTGVVSYMNTGTSTIKQISPGRAPKEGDEGQPPGFMLIFEFQPLHESWHEQFMDMLPRRPEGWEWEREFFFHPETVLR